VTPAEELRTASNILRDRATAAIHEDRTTWATGHTKGSRSPVVLDHPDTPSVLIETYAARLEAVNRYLVLVGPEAGLVIAAWLADAANDAEQIGPNPHALTVARSIITKEH
jgi:hypothetical protein